MAERYTTYSAFFDFYLSEHEKPLTRALHYCGSACGISALILTVTTANLLWIPAGLVSGYGFAWIAHFFVEHNKPATFKYPLWSFLGDYHMFALWLTGRLNKRRAAAKSAR
ncbi:Mpo1-like protein [Asticcacaulis solisilvae]|uniref:Mpo1-like protein n=1 Tax=Asticcacaulis solisilvae TaxID=1217274 RepID=UPI003FD83A0A